MTPVRAHGTAGCGVNPRVGEALGEGVPDGAAGVAGAVADVPEGEGVAGSVADAWSRWMLKDPRPDTACPSALTTRYTTAYDPSRSGRSGWVTVAPVTVARPAVTVAPRLSVTVTAAKLVLTGSVNVRTTWVGAVVAVEPDTGVIDFSEVCADAARAVASEETTASSSDSTATQTEILIRRVLPSDSMNTPAFSQGVRTVQGAGAPRWPADDESGRPPDDDLPLSMG